MAQTNGAVALSTLKKKKKYFEEIKSCHVNNYATIKIVGWLWDFDRNNFKQIE